MPSSEVAMPWDSRPDDFVITAAEWPETNSPTPRLSLSITQGRLIIRTNEAMRRLVADSSDLPRS